MSPAALKVYEPAAVHVKVNTAFPLLATTELDEGVHVLVDSARYTVIVLASAHPEAATVSLPLL